MREHDSSEQRVGGSVVTGHRTGAMSALRPSLMNRGGTAVTSTVVVSMLGLSVGAWIVAVRLMSGMDMGPAAELGSIGAFALLWPAMMAAMMLPGAVPAAVGQARTGRARAVPRFVVTYLAVWMVVGVAVYALYRPHDSAAAGAMVIAAGGYELTPLKRRFRQRCRGSVGSGLEFGLWCVGSSAGLMLMLLALGVMSVLWMSAITVIAIAQKILPAKAAIDMPLAIAIVGLGIWIVAAPLSVPGLTTPM